MPDVDTAAAIEVKEVQLRLIHWKVRAHGQLSQMCEEGFCCAILLMTVISYDPGWEK